jgi:hypothetical protein
MLTNLQTGTLPRRGTLSINRKIRDTRRQLSKSLRSQKRRTQSSYKAWHRRQYFLTSAHRDLRAAFIRNEDIVLATTFIAGVMIYGYCTIMAQILVDVLETVYTITEISSVSFTLLMMITIGVLSVTTAWVAAFISNAVSLSLIQGINRKQNRSIRLTLRQALQQTTATVMSWTLVLKQVALPLIAAGLFGIIFILTVPFHKNYWLLAIPGAAALTALIISSRRLIHTSLMPYIVLFEQNTTFADAFSRSREMISAKGRWFLAALYGSMFAALAAAYGIAFLLNKAIALPTGLTFTCAVLAILLYTNSLLTTFYSKRRRSRA